MREFNVHWKKKKSDQVNITFIVAADVETAWKKVLTIKGGVKKIDIIGAQEINRGEQTEIGEFINYTS